MGQKRGGGREGRAGGRAQKVVPASLGVTWHLLLALSHLPIWHSRTSPFGRREWFHSDFADPLRIPCRCGLWTFFLPLLVSLFACLCHLSPVLPPCLFSHPLFSTPSFSPSLFLAFSFSDSRLSFPFFHLLPLSFRPPSLQCSFFFLSLLLLHHPSLIPSFSLLSLFLQPSLRPT